VSGAQAHGFQGIIYWLPGHHLLDDRREADPPAGRAFFDMVRAHFPAQ